MFRLAIYILLPSLLTACAQVSTQATATTTLDHNHTQRSEQVGSFSIPAMTFTPIKHKLSLRLLAPSKQGDLRTTYSGEDLPSLVGVRFIGKASQGHIRVEKTINGMTLSKQLLDTPLHISHFAHDQAGELYIIDKGKTPYKLTPR